MVEGDEYNIFEPENPLTGITLAIGNYQSDTLTVDSVKYISYHFPGNDYYKKDLAEIKDTLPNLVSGIMRDLETNFSTKYPFKTLSLVEVPVQFYSYRKNNTQTRAEIQPSMVLLPEKLSTLQNAGFRKRFTRQKKRMTRQPHQRRHPRQTRNQQLQRTETRKRTSSIIRMGLSHLQP